MMGFACAWFGSRLDDAAKGGDIDLHISVPAKLDNSLWESAQFAAICKGNWCKGNGMAEKSTFGCLSWGKCQARQIASRWLKGA